MFNIMLLITDGSDKTWIKNIIDPLNTEDNLAKNLYDELIKLL